MNNSMIGQIVKHKKCDRLGYYNALKFFINDVPFSCK